MSTTFQTVDDFIIKHHADSDEDDDAGHHQGVNAKEGQPGAIRAELQLKHAHTQ